MCLHVVGSMVRQPTLIIDLGSRHGEGFEQFGCHFADARYVFVEPTKSCARYIDDVILTNPAANIQFVRGVLGDVASTIPMNVFPHDNDMSSNLYSDRKCVYGQPSVEIVDVLPYDVIKIKQDDVVFAKVNIEGAEYDLIETPFFDKIDSFVMEVHNGITRQTYVDAVASLLPRYELTSYGNTSYKYCFLIGHRRI